MPWDDLEPIDLEPVDLEPGDDGRDFERGRGPTRWQVWALVVGVGLVAWAAIAVTNHGSHARPTATPPSTAAPAPPEAPAIPRIDAGTRVVPALNAALRHVGTGRFAAIIEDRLFVFDARRSTQRLIPLPEGHATIDDESGSSLSVSTSQQTLVSTKPLTTRVLNASAIAIRAVAPSQWWTVHADRTVRNDHTAETVIEPDGLRVAAVIEQGFVAVDPSHSRWVLWSPSAQGDKITPIAPLGYKLIGAGGRSVVFWYGSSLVVNQLEIVDPSRTSQVTVDVSGIPQFAQFSPDGRHLAIASTLGDVVILDTSTGAQIATTQGITSPIPSLNFSWTPDSRFLIVVQDHRIEIRDAFTDRAVAELDIPDGVEQLVALP